MLESNLVAVLVLDATFVDTSTKAVVDPAADSLDSSTFTEVATAVTAVDDGVSLVTLSVVTATVSVVTATVSGVELEICSSRGFFSGVSKETSADVCSIF